MGLGIIQVLRGCFFLILNAMGFKIGWVIYRVRVLLTDLGDPENSLVSVLLIYDALTIARMTRQYSVYFAATSLRGGGIHF